MYQNKNWEITIDPNNAGGQANMSAEAYNMAAFFFLEEMYGTGFVKKNPTIALPFMSEWAKVAASDFNHLGIANALLNASANIAGALKSGKGLR